MDSARPLEGRRIAVTGASGGVGAATARLLAADGARVALLARRTDRIEALAQEISAAGGEAIAVATDVSDQAQVAAAFRQIEERWGGLDGLFNNAALPANNVFNTDPSDWDSIVGINLIGYMRCAREAVLLMRKGGSGGQIVNIGSLCIRVVDNGCDIYMAAKAGVKGFVDSLRKEIAPDGIQVTLVNPGQIASEMVTDTEEEKAALIEGEMMLLPEEVAEAVRYCFAMPRRVAITEMEVRPRGQMGL